MPLMLPDFLGLMSFFVERSASAASSAGGAASVIALFAIVNFPELIGKLLLCLRLEPARADGASNQWLPGVRPCV